jgi:hypothetical protein
MEVEDNHNFYIEADSMKMLVKNCMQNEWAGAQALSSFDTYLAPFILKDNMNQKEVHQCMQSFLFGMNIPSRWGCLLEDTSIGTFVDTIIELEDGRLLKVSSEQKILTKNRGLVYVKDLTDDDDIEDVERQPVGVFID